MNTAQVPWREQHYPKTLLEIVREVDAMRSAIEVDRAMRYWEKMRPLMIDIEWKPVRLTKRRKR